MDMCMLHGKLLPIVTAPSFLTDSADGSKVVVLFHILKNAENSETLLPQCGMGHLIYLEYFSLNSTEITSR